ncbi:MAG: cache domain-containing protein [Chloroflexota bacterium]
MRGLVRSIQRRLLRIRIPIATKLILSFLLIIISISALFVLVGIRLISNQIVSEAQEKVRNDLNAAREIYLDRLFHVNMVIQFTAERFFLRDALLSGNIEQATDELIRVREDEGLDILAITDKYGNVLLRANNVDVYGDNQGHDELVGLVLLKREPLSSTMIVSGEDLQKESPLLAVKAYFWFIETPLARAREEKSGMDGMMLKAVAPIFDYQHNLIGTVYGGVLLNRNYDIVDKVKQTVYQDVVYKGKDIGTATIFQDDVRISTNVRYENGTRAIGTRVSEEVYNQVVLEGKPWIGRAYVVNNWYITAYEPIKDINNRIIGILYVGVLEQKYLDIRQQTILTFMVITLAGALVSLVVSYFIAQRILIPINKLVSASKELAQGNLDARVAVITNDELQYLAESFNAMAQALKRRDEQLKKFATQKIMESERLALVGHLAANVAHELNNPLQGIVTYSHLLLESNQQEEKTKESIRKIVHQANRCRDIIRGLLDFSRQRMPDKTLCSINSVIQECVSLVENQALFHNIKITKDFQADIPLIVIDPSQIERVFMNMIINAAEAMNGSGQLTLSSRHLPAQKVVEVEITDTGQGISKENLEKIFDPFFTTKEVGHGTGLGLAISYGIVTGHKGTISVKSEVGKGTSFIISLPTKAVEEENSHAH